MTSAPDSEVNVLLIVAILGFIAFAVLVADVAIINLLGIIVSIAMCICIFGGAVLIVRKLKENK